MVPPPTLFVENGRARLRHHWRRKLQAALAAMALLTATPGTARAAVELGDLETSVRVLNFLKPVPSGTIVAAIVYPVGSAEGRAEADQIAALFNGGLHTGGATVQPEVIDTNGLAKISPAMVFLTKAALAQAASIAAQLAGRSVLTVAFDRAPVEADLVIMAVQSSPRVEILVSREAAQKAGVNFAAGFRMMILER